METFVWDISNKAVKMLSSSSEDFFEGKNYKVKSANKNTTGDADLIMEQILDNINTTPIGQVLKKIASLPEIRRKKVLDVRRQLTDGKYELNERLDIALEKVLEDLIT